MIKIGTLKKGDWFVHKDRTYKVESYDYVFTNARKVKCDGTKHIFLNSIMVDTKIIDTYHKTNPDYNISDLRKQNND